MQKITAPMQCRSFWPSLIATSVWFLPVPPVMALWLVLDARLVDPLWRAFAARALQVAA